MKKIFLFSAVVFLLVGGGCAKNIERVDLPNEKPIGGETDEHGCLTSAGYSWCEENQKCLRVWEEWCGDRSNKIVSEIETLTEVEFTKEATEEMEWRVESEILKLTGTKYFIKETEYKTHELTINYFDENFEQNIDNAAGGVTGGLTGFTKDYTACTLSYEYPYGENSEEGPFVPDTSRMNMTIECGLFNPNWTNDKPVELPKFSTTCESAGGHWNECSNKCALAAQGQDGVACTLQCEQLCECGGIAGFACPANHECIIKAEGIADAMGYCEITFDEPVDEPSNNGEVNNFEDCVEAGNPIMESYPQQCRHGDRTYTENVEIKNDLEIVELQM